MPPRWTAAAIATPHCLPVGQFSINSGAISINTVATAIQAMTSAIVFTNTLICINAQIARWEFN
jgi:hypothetical protein